MRKIMSLTLVFCLALSLTAAACKTANADIDKSTVEAGRVHIKGQIDSSHDLVVRIDRGDKPIEWRSSRTGGGEFEVVVEASDKIRLEDGKTGHGFVVTTKILTSSDINYVHCAGDLAGTFAIRRKSDFVTYRGVLTFADVTFKDGKKLPVSLRLALSRTAAPVRADDKSSLPAQVKKPGAVFKAPGSHTLDVALSPDGKILARAGTGKTIDLWDVATGKERVPVKGHPHGVMSMAFSADGKTLATSSVGLGDFLGAVKLWDVASGKEKMELGVRASSLAFSPDGKTLAMGVDGFSDEKPGSVQLWDLTTGKKRASMPGNRHGSLSIAFTPDGKTLVSAGGEKEQGNVLCLKLWEVATPKERATIAIPEFAHPQFIPLVFTADGRTLITAGWNEKDSKGEITTRLSVKHWDLATGKAQTTFWTAENPGGDPVRLVELAISAMHEHALNVAGPYFAALSADGKTVAWGGTEGAHAWDVQSLGTSPPEIPKEIEEKKKDIEELFCLTGHTGRVWGVCVSADSKRLLTCSDADKTLRLWDADTGKELRQMTGHTDAVWSVAFGPEGKAISGGARMDGTMRLWDLNTGKQAAVFSVDGYHVALAYSAKARLAATYTWTRIRLWDLETGKEVRKWTGHGSDFFESVSFSPDGERLLSTSPGGPVRIWDVKSGQGLTDVDDGGAYCAAFSPDGKRVASGGKGGVRVWDVESGNELRRYEGHTKEVLSVAYFPDGKRIASASDDGTARIWRAPNPDTKPEPVKEQEDTKPIPKGPDAKAQSAAPELPEEPKKSDPAETNKSGEGKKQRMVTLGVIVLISAKTEGMSEGAKIKQIDVPKESIGKRDISNAHVTKVRAAGSATAAQPRLNGTWVAKTCTVTLADGESLEKREVLFGIDVPPQALKNVRFVETVQAESDQGVGTWHAYDAADMQIPVPDDWDAHVAQAKVIDALKKLGAAVKFSEESNENLAVQVSFTDVFATDAALKELAGLKQLRTLNLHFFDPASTGPIPVTDAGLAELKGHASLKSLNLRRTRVTDKGLKELKPLQALQALILRETQITDAGLLELKALQRLQVLDLGVTRITDTGLKELTGLKDLQTLNVDGTQVTAAGVKELQAALPNLQILGVEDAAATQAEEEAMAAIQKIGGDYEKLAGGPYVKFTRDEKAPGQPVIGVTFNTGAGRWKEVTDAGLAELKTLQNLQKLGIGYNEKLTGTGLAELKDLKNLQHLDLIHSSVTDAGAKSLAELQSLKTIDLRGTQITDAGLNKLQRLQNLKELNLCLVPGGPFDVTREGVKELQAALPEAKILR